MIKKLKKYNLCIGCGLCQSVLGSGKCKVRLNSAGFYEPIVESELDRKDRSLLKCLCPAVCVETEASKGFWGNILAVTDAWSANDDIRYRASSGGVVTSLAVHMLEKHYVDAVLHVGVCKNSYLHNELKISLSAEDVLSNIGSRYAPAMVFNNIKHVFESTEYSFGFVGKPCDIAGMRNFLRVFPQWKDRVRYYISIFCAGMPSYNATIKTWKLSGHTDAPARLKYRGDGWPGFFKADFNDGTTFSLSYNESWGCILGRDVPFRCKICPDGIGMLADIAVGDSWNTKDGYPDFTESDGRNFCMVRSANGMELMESARKAGAIICSELGINKVKDLQPYQCARRKLEGYRLLPVQIATGFLLKFKGLSIFWQALYANPLIGINNMLGTFRRMMKLKNAHTVKFS